VSLTPETLRAAGEALYGPRWQSELARLVDRPQSNVAEWASGARSIPVDVWPLLSTTLWLRSEAVLALAKKIDKAR
jgi:hypothetical protein